MAEALLRDWDGPLLVLPGDAPLLSASLLEALIAHHTHAGAAVTLLTATLDDAGAYGRVVRDAETGRVRGIVEARDATPEQLLIREIGTSVYAFEPAALFDALRQITPQNAQGEYYLTDAIALLAEQGRLVEAVVSPDADVVRGVNNRAELVELREVMQARVHADPEPGRRHHLGPPDDAHRRRPCKIGPDTTIHPFTLLSGVTDIGEDCEIGPGARISDSKIGRGVSVRDSLRHGQRGRRRLQDRPLRQPPPRQRPGPERQDRRLRGTQKRPLSATASPRVICPTSATPKSARGTNIGAGTITCNYDRSVRPTKNKTIIGADAFVGTHSTLVAPVILGDGA